MVPTTILPAPRVNIAIRPGTMNDVPFIDSLQKKQSKEVGFFPTKAIEGKVRLGHVLIAEVGNDEVGTMNDEPRAESSLIVPRSSFQPVGYLIGNDQYFKRDDVGCIFQINVVAEYRRSLVAASLLKAQFERSAYGCKLYCCWCAQDIGANRFWESMGFVPLAFRTGSEKKSRTHIFWQKRIRTGDSTTPWWFPSQTSGGSIREDRIVLPIPPGKHWSEEMPRVVPGDGTGVGGRLLRDDASEAAGLIAPPRALPMSTDHRPKTESVLPSTKDHRPSTKLGKTQLPKSYSLRGVIRVAEAVPVASTKVKPTKEKVKREKKPKQKNDPTLVAAARELRDRWLDEVNSGRTAGIAMPIGKYDVVREIGVADSMRAEPVRLIEQAA